MNGYLYVTNPLLRAIRIAAYFEQDVPNEILYPENCSCSQNVDVTEKCKNPLDKEYACPGYLEKQVLELVSQKLLNTYFRVKEDMTQNNLDGQAERTITTFVRNILLYLLHLTSGETFSTHLTTVSETTYLKLEKEQSFPTDLESLPSTKRREER